MCRNYSPMARLEVERERWLQEHGTEMPRPEPRTSFMVIAPVKVEALVNEDCAGS